MTYFACTGCSSQYTDQDLDITTRLTNRSKIPHYIDEAFCPKCQFTKEFIMIAHFNFSTEEES